MCAVGDVLHSLVQRDDPLMQTPLAMVFVLGYCVCNGHLMLENKIRTALTVHSTIFPACLQMENTGKEKATLALLGLEDNGDHGYFLPSMSK